MLLSYHMRRLANPDNLVTPSHTTWAQAGWLGAARSAGLHELHLLEEVIAQLPMADEAYN